MSNRFQIVLAALVTILSAAAQTAPPTSVKPPEHLIGTITGTDSAAHTITVKEDKTGTEQLILLADTKTLIKVAPGAKDLKNATRITSDQLQTGDRVDIRGFKAPDDTSKIAARSLVLMSARDLEAAHAAQAAEWQHSIAGVVTAVDGAGGKIMISARSAQGPRTVTLTTSPQTEFTRYSPETPTKPTPSQITQVQAGDQVRVIGEKSDDGATITATKVYSAAFRTLNGTLLSTAPDGKQITVKDLATKKPVTVVIGANTAIRKLPPEMAMRLAQRSNAGTRPGPGVPPSGSPGNPGGGGGANADSSSPAGRPPADGPSEAAGGQRAYGGGMGGGMRGPRNGDISQLIERLPAINVNDLKPGDAVVVSGAVIGGNTSQVSATNVIAGVEPILQSAPASRGGQALGGDWGLGQIEAPQQ